MEKRDMDEPAWSRDVVEQRLVDAFRVLPTHPVFTQRDRVRSFTPRAEPYAAPLNWTARFAVDRDDALVLLTWARCRAQGESASERYRALGWKRPTAERARRRAIDRIVACLQIEQRRLDNETNAAGASCHDETDAGLASA